MILAAKFVGEVAVSDFHLRVHGVNHGFADFVVSVRFARAAVVNAACDGIVQAPQIDFGNVLDVDEIAFLFAVAVAARTAEQSGAAAEFHALVDLIENRCHFTFVALLLTENVKVAQADDFAFGLADKLSNVAVEHQLRERVGIERTFALFGFAKTFFARAVNRST